MYGSWGMDGGWTGNTFLLGSSSLVHDGGEHSFRFYYFLIIPLALPYVLTIYLHVRT
jgi:hypothetical protein